MTRRHGPWGPRKPVSFADRVHRLARLEAQLGDHYAYRRVSTNFRLQAFVWRVQVVVSAYDEEYSLRIELDERRAVSVTVEDWRGPSMRHTFGANTLCMWYPRDPPDRQWHPADGLLTLVDTAAAHLFKELYFRETGEWLGEEVHPVAPKTEGRGAHFRAA